jgi:rhamnose transport system permease protein
VNGAKSVPAALSGLEVGQFAGRVARLREAGILVVLLVLVAAVGVRVPRFLALDNLEQILLSVAVLAIAASGETLVVLTKNVDLSIDAMIGLTAFVVGDLLKQHRATVPEAVLVGIALGLALGAFNGLVVTLGKVPSIVATLGTMSVYRGIDFLVAGGTQVSSYDVPAAYLRIATGSILGVPALIVYAVVVVAVLGYLLRYARAGRQLYAVGSNPDAARLIGIPSAPLVFGTFVVSGTLGGLAGVLWGSRFGTINAYAADGMVLEVIAAVVVGGVNIFGGSGTVFGAVLGAVLLGTIENALTLLLISQFWLQAIDGAVILAAVGIDAAITRRLQKALVSVRGL